jgi:2-desacetyl-2-hydroxyethyl bacteriochlorophyllide A dehydrogenase
MPSIKTEIYELAGPGQLALNQTVLNSDCAPKEIIAETIVSAISPGTETAAYAGMEPLRPGKVYPRVLGYCNVAHVTNVGEGARFSEGDLILTFQSHRTIFKLQSADFALKVPSNISPKHAATAYLYHLGYHGLLTADARSGHNVVVIGAGTLGFTSALMSRVTGCRTFVFSNQTGAKKALTQAGFESFEKTKSSIDELYEQTHNIGADIVINTSNTWEDWKLALQLVNKGGCIVNLGFPGRNQALPDFNPLDPQYVYTKNVTIKALCPINETDIPAYEIRHNMHRNLTYILDLIAGGALNPDLLISNEIPYTQLEDAYRVYLNKTSNIFTTILNWK